MFSNNGDENGYYRLALQASQEGNTRVILRVRCGRNITHRIRPPPVAAAT